MFFVSEVLTGQPDWAESKVMNTLRPSQIHLCDLFMLCSLTPYGFSYTREIVLNET